MIEIKSTLRDAPIRALIAGREYDIPARLLDESGRVLREEDAS